MMGLQEVCVNWRNTRTNLSSMLRRGSDPIRSVVSFNKRETERVGNSQRGGTASIAHDALAKYIKDSGADHTNLGRWSWFRLEGEPGHFTRVVTASQLPSIVQFRVGFAESYTKPSTSKCTDSWSEVYSFATNLYRFVVRGVQFRYESYA